MSKTQNMRPAEPRESTRELIIRAASLQLIGRLGAAAAVCTGLYGLSTHLSWTNGGDASPPLVMSLFTAFGLIFFGGSVIFSWLRLRRLALAGGILIALLGLVKIIDLFVMDGLTDHFIRSSHFYHDIIQNIRNTGSGAGPAMVIVGISIALSQFKKQKYRLTSQIIAIIFILHEIFLYFVHATNMLDSYAFASGLVNILPTLLGGFAGGIALLSLTPDVGLLMMLHDRGPAGAICRMTLPLILAAPVLSVVVQIWAVENNLLDAHDGMAVQVLSSVLIPLAVLLATALALHRSDQARRARVRELRHSDQFNRLIASANPDCVGLIGDANILLFANEAFIETHEKSQKGSEFELLGYPCGHYLEPEQRVMIDAALDEARQAGSARFTVLSPRMDGEARWYDTLITRLPSDRDSPFRLLMVSRDITDKKAIEDRVQWQALHDELTRLPNRAYFQAKLDQSTEVPGDLCCAIMMIDVDDFKLINDTAGHDAGDTLLTTIAERIVQAVREEDFVARLAGDEFAIILHDVRSEAGVMATAERIYKNLRTPWVYDGRPAECRISIGAAIAHKHGDSVAELLKNADIALYAAKAKGKGQLAIFESEMKANVEKRMRQLTLAREALRDDRIVAYYQPKVDLARNRLAGFEALLRWRNPQGRLQMPSSVEAAFDDMELAAKITDCMLTRVLSDIRPWLDNGVDFGHVAVNLTAADIRQPDFVHRLLDRLDALSIPREYLQVEITEAVFLGRGAENVMKSLQLLNTNGISIALDDFGTGYASLSHLKRCPVDAVKIDRSFLRDFGEDPQSRAIISTIAGLSRSLNIDIVAEGVETVEQAHYLVSNGCAYGQGHLFGKAMPASRVPELIKTMQREVVDAA